MRTCSLCHGNYAENVAFCPRDGAALRLTSSLAPGTILRKKYRILGEIAHGGMGVVYRAQHLLWNEEKAIKILLGSVSNARQRSDGFLAEALVMRQLQHPNVVRVEDVDFTDEDQLFVVMEYVPGESLDQRISRGVLPWQQALQYAAQACTGLAVAHRKGVIHRDIKPQNLLLTLDPDGREIVKLIDFGVAKVREEAALGVATPENTQTGTFRGTPEYASPEQAMGMRADSLDARTDLYSLGLVMYEMLTGVRPFDANTPLASLMRRVYDEAVPPSQLRPDLGLPRSISDLVMKAMARDRDARFASAEEMLRAIEGELQTRGTAEARDAIPGKRRYKAAWLAAGGAIAGVVTLAAWLHQRPVPPPPQSVPASHQVQEVKTFAVAENPKAPVAEEKKSDVAPTDVAPAVSRVSVPPVTSASAAPAGQPSNERTPAPVSTPQTSLRQVKINPQDGLEYIWIAAGSFLMGCSPGDQACNSDEIPAHQVTFTKGFWIGKTEVTQTAYARVMGHTPPDSQDGSLPVGSVSWFSARAYCKAVGMRLPSEAEWEYAARGATAASHYGSLGEIAWWFANGGGRPHPVAQKLPNEYGLFDMLGNVTEWTADWYGPYAADAVTDPTGPTEGKARVQRGGSWLGNGASLRVSQRHPRLPVANLNYVGLRCAGN